MHPLSNEIFSFFIENKFPSAYNESDPGSGGLRKRNSFTSAFGKLDIDEISISVHEGSEIKLEEKDQLKILSILYAIIFSHFIESQLRVKSHKDTISILEDKIQSLRDKVQLEIDSKTTLQNQLKITQQMAESSKTKIKQSACRTIQKYWRRYIQHKRSKKIIQERIERLREIQNMEKIRRSISATDKKKQPSTSSVSESIKEEATKVIDEYFESDDESPKDFEFTPKEEMKQAEQEIEGEEEFDDELNEEEVLYLKNTGRFFILDSMRQLDTLFSDLHHNFVEMHFKKESKGGMFSSRKTKTKTGDTSEESD